MKPRKNKPRTMLGASAGSKQLKSAWRLSDLANTASPDSATDNLDYGALTDIQNRVGSRTMYEFFKDIARGKSLRSVCEDFSRLDDGFLTVWGPCQ